MLKDNLTYGLQKFWMSRLLFLVFLAIFAQSPIADAYSDSLCSSLIVSGDLGDPSDGVVTSELNLDNDSECIDDLKASKQASKDYQAFLHRVLIQDKPACHILPVSISATSLKTSQICPPVSSDSSPPVV